MAFPGAHKVVQLPRGNTATVSLYVGLASELFADTEAGQLRMSDGSTAGGWVFYNKTQIDAMIGAVSFPSGTGEMAEAGTDTVQRVWPATAFAGFAELEDPVFIGTPQVPTRALADDSPAIANTEWVRDLIGSLAGNNAMALAGADAVARLWPATAFGQFAPKSSPALSGIPTTPTPAAGITTTQIVNAAWVAANFRPMPSNTGTASLTSFPVGTTLFASGVGSTYPRNSVVSTLTLDAANFNNYVIGASGDAIAGTWRIRGRGPVAAEANAPYYLVERVA